MDTVATLTLGLRPRQRGCKVAGQEEAWGLRQEEAQELKVRRAPRVTSHSPGSVKKCEGV